ncbi:Holliday junction branch migration protein RuvA [Sporosalibacterium faouarense]|uniref:Holliday junction branch migration protein RuvA n=1 Tax=Sporosalibacterium faouarense TaxID=516123 RepID=UPI00141D7218|nr:Holliday junction branch migration protein RuvA [Sporosalibacterium faouarense]MTI47798.1 Holliday junction branch migration protein RuvA [Bacillota bacterium]
MFQYIKGKIEEIGDNYVVVENNNIGYLIHTSKNSISNLNKDVNNCKVYTYLNVREDEMSLYGFATKEELDMFNLLLKVSKIGPKVALGVLSTMTPSNIKIAIFNNDVTTLTKAPGIGKKTANRVILELKDKIDDKVDLENVVFGNDIESDFDEVSAALVSLGYNRNEISRVLSKIDKTALDTEGVIKKALKELAKM